MPMPVQFPRPRRALAASILAGAVALPLLVPSVAQARYYGYGYAPGALVAGTVLGLGAAAAIAGAYPPPAYYAPPPVYYAPPPVYYAPPPAYAVPPGYYPPRVAYAPY